MQGYIWSSNQRPPPMYQERPLPYPATSSYQPQFNPQPYASKQPEHSSTRQGVVNNWNTPQAGPLNSADAFAYFQRNPGRYDGQINQTVPRHPFTGHQQHHRFSNSAAHNAERPVSQPRIPCDNLNTNKFYAQFNTQSCSNVSSQQNYRNTGPANTNVGPGQAHTYWTQHSDHGSSTAVTSDNTRGWSCPVSDNGRLCLGRNQQQPQPPRPSNLHHQHNQHSGQQQTPGIPSQSTHQAQSITQRLLNYQAQGRMAVHYTSHSSATLPPAGPQKNISPPSHNFQQSCPELRSNGGPKVSATQSQNSQSKAGHQAPGTNSKVCNINQSSQNQIHQRAHTNQALFNPTPRPDFNLKDYIESKLYQIMSSNESQQDLDNNLATNKQPSVDRVQNTCPGYSEVHATNGTDHYSHAKQVFSQPDLQSVFEPPSKRLNYDVIQRDYCNQFPNKNASVFKDNSGLRLQSALPGSHQMDRMEQNRTEMRHSGMRQSEITYSTDPADCLEAVFALQKAFLQVHKAVAIVPPISQQTSNTEEMDDTSPRIVDSPPLKIDAVWSIAEESDSKNPFTKANEELTPASPPKVEEDEKINPENETANNIADPCVAQRTEECSANPTAACQSDVQQKDCDSSDTVFELSSVPMVEYTLEELMNLVMSLETTNSSAEYTENVYDRILDLYWNGNIENLMKHMNVTQKLIRHSVIESVKNDKSVVFESIAPENFKKLAHCHIVNEICSSPKEFRSSWLNVDGQPADIAKVLSEPMSDDITLSMGASENVCVPAFNSGVNSFQVRESINADEQSVMPNSELAEDVFTPSPGNGRAEPATENKGHSYADISGATFLCHIPSEQETFKKKGDIMQNHNHLNTKATDVLPLADMSSKELRDDNTTEMLSQGHIRDKQEHSLTLTKEVLESALLIEQQVNLDSDQPRDNLPATDLLPVCPKNKTLQFVSAVSDGAKYVLLTALTNSTDTMQVEDISDDENSGNKEALTNSTDTMQVEDISDDENLGNKETLTNSTDTWLVEDISDNDSSSDDSLVMGITVLAFEDALQFFQQLETVTQCDIKIESTQSNVEHQELVGPSQPNHENNKANICSPFGTNSIVKCNSTHVTKIDNDGELFCSLSWDMAPSLNLEMEPYSPKRNETDTLSSATKSEELGPNHTVPSLEPEVLEPIIASAAANNADEEMTEKPESNSVVKSVPDKTPEIHCTVEQELTKIQPDKAKDENSEKISVPRPQPLMQCNKPPKSKSAFFKLKSGRNKIGSDDPVLFAPDIVIKKNWSQKKNHSGRHLTAVSAINCGGKTQNCRSVKNIMEPRQKRQDPPSQAETDGTSQSSTEKVREKESDYSAPYMATTLHGENLSVKKNQPKKVKFALYGSNREHQCAAQGRRFSPPTSLTVLDWSKNKQQCLPQGRRFSAPATLPLASKNYSDRLSARQKVHNQWSSTFIPKVKKTFPPKSAQKEEPPKKKMQKPHEVLKSNMVSLKEHLIHRAMLLSSKSH